MAVSETKSRQAAEHACITCGRGEINATLLADERLRVIDTSLVLVVCADVEAHRPRVGRHLGRCSGFVYQHRDFRICEAVERVNAKPKIILAGGN